MLSLSGFELYSRWVPLPLYDSSVQLGLNRVKWLAACAPQNL